MSTKINQLLQQWPSGNVATGRWLANLGIDRRLADKYVQSGWLERLGYGAYTRAGAAVDWLGAVHALQTQLGLSLHPGGRTALELRGYTHYLPFGVRPAVLFGSPGTKLPAWFLAQSWARSVTLVTTGFLEGVERSTSPISVHAIDLEVATCERAALEMMYLVPRRQSYEEAFQLLESLTFLRPRVVQELLECCTSVKAKRLFMHAAERVNHPWLQYLDLSGVDFGSGRRTIHAGGRLDRKYDLVVADPTQA
jgi:hypothetical protein